MTRVTTLDELAHLSDDRIDVALGAALIARDVYGTLDVRAVLARLDALAAPLVARHLAGEPAERQAEEIARYLFDDIGFQGNQADYYDPRNSLLSDVLDRRLGIPITLSLVYCEVARRAGVDAHGVSFPGHFLARIERPHDRRGPLVTDPFFGGRVLQPAELEKLLRRSLGKDAVLSPTHVAAASPRAILVRMLTNLKVIYTQRGDIARAHLALDRIVSLAPGSVEALRERAALAAKLGSNEAARADLARSLEIDASSEGANEVRARLAELEAKAKRRTQLN